MPAFIVRERGREVLETITIKGTSCTFSSFVWSVLREGIINGQNMTSFGIAVIDSDAMATASQHPFSSFRIFFFFPLFLLDVYWVQACFKIFKLLWKLF